MATTPNEEALRIAEGVLGTIQENKSLSVTNLLRKCVTIAELLELEDIQWINNELKGYLNDNVPTYRLVEVECVLGWHGSLYPKIDEREKELFFRRWKEKINIKESSVILEFWTQGTHEIMLRQGIKMGITVDEKAWLKPEQTWEILHRVVDRIDDLVLRIIIDLKFKGRIESIFSETRQFVDRRLSMFCPTVLGNLETAYENAIKSDSPLELSQVAFACRQILQDFTDFIYAKDYLPEGERPPKKEQTLNKVRFTLMAKLGASKGTERKLIESQVRYLLDYFSRLNDAIQKGIHPEQYEVRKEDANRCIIYTYLIIGDILRLL